MKRPVKFPQRWLRYGGRASALLAPAVFCLIVYLIVSPIQNAFQDRSELIEEKKSQIARYTSFVRRSKFTRPVAGAEVLGQHRTHVFLASSPSIASSKLQTLLKSIASSNSLQLSSLRTLSSNGGADRQSIGVRVNMRGRLEQLQKVVHTVENAKPFMFIEAAAFSSRRAASSAKKQPTLIDLQLDVRGQYEIEKKARGT